MAVWKTKAQFYQSLGTLYEAGVPLPVIDARIPKQSITGTIVRIYIWSVLPYA